MESFGSRPAARPLGRALRLEGLQALIEAVEEMRSDGELRPGVDPVLLATLVSGVRRGVTIDWMAGRIELEDLTHMTICSACFMLAGATTGQAADRCQRIALEHQQRLSTRPPGIAPELVAQEGSRG